MSFLEEAAQQITSPKPCTYTTQELCTIFAI